MGATVLATAYVLMTCVPHPAQLAGDLRSPHAWVAEAGADAAARTLASALLWLVALWVAGGLTAAAVSLAPGRLGQLGAALADRVTPAALRRVVIMAAGTSILLGPTAAVAVPATGGPPSTNSAASVLPPLGWPLDPSPGTHGAPPARAGDRVTVRPGDSLWSIAADRLGATASAARVRAEWPRWYAANRRVIGADPNLIQPGVHLLAPPPERTDTHP